MANEEHLAILNQGVEVWNEWMEANPGVDTDLRGAYLSDANLRGANLANARLTGANLLFANLFNADLRGANLANARLTGANLRGANLSGANLFQVQALSINFKSAILTGALIQDWNINADTNLKHVICDYVYLKWGLDQEDWSERRPSDPNKNFAPGEFIALVQKSLSTVDLIFADGIDWRAFFQSFQELQTQYADQELSIQAIEKKAGGAFVIRLETPAIDVDKAAIEAAAMEKYQSKLQLLESRYEERLQLQGEQLEFYRQQTEIERNRNTRLDRIIEVMADKAGDNYYGTIKATNFAPRGTAIGGTFNDYSQTITNNLDEIGQLINTLRSQAEQFPPAEREAVEVHLGELEEASNQPQKQDPKRIKAKLMALLMIAGTVGGVIATATDFSNNVLELGKKFGIELVQPKNPQSTQSTPPIEVKKIEGGAP